MPIRAENRARYPKNWKSEIVPHIRQRSGNRCECTGECGVSHGRADEINSDPPRCHWFDGNIIDPSAYPVRRIVLTVGHLNHTPEDCRPENLKHWCQGCHNRYDAPTRRAGIKARAHAQRASGDLFACTEAS